MGFVCFHKFLNLVEVISVAYFMTFMIQIPKISKTKTKATKAIGTQNLPKKTRNEKTNFSF